MNAKNANDDPGSALEDLLYDCSVRHSHPLTGPVAQDDLIPLGLGLQARFAHTLRKLDGLSETVWRVREAATEYAQRAMRRGRQFTDDDHLRIMRQLTGYLGNTYLLASGGEWMQGTCLIEAAVREKCCFVLGDDEERKTVIRRVLSVSILAANLWGLALTASTEPLDLFMATYVVWPDGRAKWEHPRVQICSTPGYMEGFPSAWSAG